MLISKKDASEFYIGASSDLKKREGTVNIKKHPGIQGHVRKYGPDDLEFYVIEYCKVWELYEKEQYYISELQPSLNTYRFATNTHYNGALSYCKEDSEFVFNYETERQLLEFLSNDLPLPEII